MVRAGTRSAHRAGNVLGLSDCAGAARRSVLLGIWQTERNPKEQENNGELESENTGGRESQACRCGIIPGADDAPQRPKRVNEKGESETKEAPHDARRQFYARSGLRQHKREDDVAKKKGKVETNHHEAAIKRLLAGGTLRRTRSSGCRFAHNHRSQEMCENVKALAPWGRGGAWKRETGKGKRYLCRSHLAESGVCQTGTLAPRGPMCSSGPVAICPPSGAPDRFRKK